MTREEKINNTEQCVCGKKEQDYEATKDIFQPIAGWWNDFFDGLFTEKENNMLNKAIKNRK